MKLRVNTSKFFKKVFRKLKSTNDLTYLHSIEDMLREKYCLHIVIILTENCHWTYKIIDFDIYRACAEIPPYENVCSIDYGSYEEALQAAIFEIIQHALDRK